MISHEYFDFFAERLACEEQMVKMAKAMGHPEAKSGKDFIAALDGFIAAVRCQDLRMSDNGITREELPQIVRLYHNVWGGDNSADPLPLSDEDMLGILERSYR